MIVITQPKLKFWVDKKSVCPSLVWPEHKHDHGLDGGWLECLVRLRVVLQGHPVELSLVDVGHLVVLPPHCAAGGGVQDVPEPVRGVQLGDLDLLCITGSTRIKSDISLSPSCPTCCDCHSHARACERWCCRSGCSECSQSSCRCPLSLSALSAIRREIQHWTDYSAASERIILIRTDGAWVRCEGRR